MKPTTAFYIIALAVSIFLPFFTFDNFVSADRDSFLYYYLTAAVYLLAMITAIANHKDHQRITSRILSFFVLISALFHFTLLVLVLLLELAEYLDRSRAFFGTLAAFQLGLIILASLHIRPQNNNTPNPIDDVEF